MNTEKLESLIEAVIDSMFEAGFDDKDYVCFNIGNTNLKLFSDH